MKATHTSPSPRTRVVVYCDHKDIKEKKQWLSVVQNIEKRTFPKHESMSGELLVREMAKVPNDLLLLILDTDDNEEWGVGRCDSTWRDPTRAHSEPSCTTRGDTSSTASIVVGYLLVSSSRPSVGARILKLCIAPQHRRHGHGRTLLTASLQHLRDRRYRGVKSEVWVRLHVDPERYAAVQLYRTLHFEEECAVVTDYYMEGRSAQVMSRVL
eukprot:TRINITY_DN17261_c0_g1_i1.p1 TRINITY_DN17261_c0_g1~~TRINITY_DN17261_c0_g1_i1.p1  ORF type:complete len:212 (+),score=38.35 TRINITY_DN17261_c0_g1_i1:160-795(+)